MTVEKRIVSAAITLLGLVGFVMSAGYVSAKIDTSHTTQSEYSDINHSEPPNDQNEEIIVELTDQINKMVFIETDDGVVRTIYPKSKKRKIDPKPKPKSKPASEGTATKMEVSAYTTSKRECGNRHGKTSTGEKAIAGKTCAVSRNLYKKYVGKHILIPGKGVRYVNDKMARGIKNSVDLTMQSRTEAKNFGRKKLEIVLLD